MWFIIPRGLILCHHLLTIVFALSSLLIRHQGCCWIQSHVSSKENSWKHHRAHKNPHKLHLNSADWGTRSVLLYDCFLHLSITLMLLVYHSWYLMWLRVLSAMRHTVFFCIIKWRYNGSCGVLIFQESCLKCPSIPWKLSKGPCWSLQTRKNCS